MLAEEAKVANVSLVNNQPINGKVFKKEFTPCSQMSMSKHGSHREVKEWCKSKVFSSLGM